MYFKNGSACHRFNSARVLLPAAQRLMRLFCQLPSVLAGGNALRFDFLVYFTDEKIF